MDDQWHGAVSGSQDVPENQGRKDLGGTGRVVTVSKDLKGCHTEGILLGPMCSTHTDTLSLTQLSNGQS